MPSNGESKYHPKNDPVNDHLYTYQTEVQKDVVRTVNFLLNGCSTAPTPACQTFSENFTKIGFFLSLPMKSKPFGCFHRQFEPVFTVGPSENSVLNLEPVKNRESESSRPISPLSGATLKVALALQKSLFEQRAQRVVCPGLGKLANPFDFLPRNKKRPAVDLSTPGVKSFGRQS